MALISANDAAECYEKASRMGKKEGEPIAVLDDILKEKNISILREIPLGLVQIPMNQIAGTKTEGRSAALSRGFYPLLDSKSEFASKWISLCKAHLDEGIRDPIKAYEFMNRFYVSEGNKRVSVLKFFDAVSVPGYVTRIIPPWSEDKDVRIYYAFMDFYRLSSINYIWFSREESFSKLQQLVGKRPDEIWTKDDQMDFNSIYTRFCAEYENIVGKRLSITPGDAFLFFISIYDYHSLNDMTTAELKEKLAKAQEEFYLLMSDDSLELQMEPEENVHKKNLLTRLIPASTPRVKVAFVQERSAESSIWAYAHELGRMHLEETFSDQVSTVRYENVTAENADETLEKAIRDGNNLIFTTSPPLLKASLKAAIENPEVKILNCSLNTSHRHIRTYYARMYEAKFLTGAIAGAISETGKLGYIADYPIFGMTANINAFALGAKMVNPRAKVYLEWSTLKDSDPYETLRQKGIQIISGLDMALPGDQSRQFGLYSAESQMPRSLAMPVWHWGKFYEQMIRNIMDGSWKYDDASDETKGLNYWWGMSAGIVDVICSHHLPIGTIRLIEMLRSTLCRDDFNPFSGVLYSQNGMVQNDPDKALSPEEIIEMDWLAENVEGRIPAPEELVESAKPVVDIQGIETAGAAYASHDTVPKTTVE